MGVNQVLLGAVKIMDISDSTVTADKMLSGVTAYDKAGDKITGSIRDNGSVSATFDGIDTKSVSVPAGYTSGGTVALDGTIDAEVGTQADLISQIATALEGKAAGSGGGSGDVPTCTVTVSAFDDIITSYGYSYFRNGEYGYDYVNFSDPEAYISEVVMTNIICGSFFDVYNKYSYTGAIFSDNIRDVNINSHYSGVYRAPTTTGDSATMTLFDDD